MPTRSGPSSRRIFFWLAAGPLVLTVLTLGIVMKGNQRQAEVTHTFQVLEAINKVQRSVSRVQVAARTFLFTRQAPGLKDYTVALVRVDEGVALLSSLVADNPQQIDELMRFKRALNRRDLVYERSFEQRLLPAPSAGAGNTVWPDGAITDELDAILESMRARESQLLLERSSQAHQSQDLLFALYGVGLVVNGWIAYVGYQLAVKYGYERDETESGIRRLNAELETRVGERTLEVERNMALLKRSNAELERFAYIASHDLQEPVRQMGSFVSLLSKRYSPLLDDEGRRYVEFAVGGAKRIQELINALLVYSSLGSTPLQMSECPLCELWIRCVRRAEAERSLAGSYQDLPAVAGDSRRIEMVFDALIANSIKFRQPDRPLELSVRAVAGPEFGWKVTVADNGMGFDPQYIPQALSVFGRLNSLSRYPGAGMGLAIVKRIVEDHGGNVTIDTAVGRGTAVSFTIPGRPPKIDSQN